MCILVLYSNNNKECPPLILTVPPDPPSGLEVTDQTTTTLSLQWTNRGDGLSPITGIEIEYQIQGTGGGVTETISEVVEEFTLENLVPFSTYDIQVFVVNAVERSEPNTTTGTTDSLRKFHFLFLVCNLV